MRENSGSRNSNSSYEENVENEDALSMDAESSSSTPRKPSPPKVVANRYRLGKLLGSGSYSDVHFATDKVTGDGVAVKLEWKRAEKTNKLLGEVDFYEDVQNVVGIPRVHWSGSKGEYNIMVLDLLGPSLDNYFKKRKRFSLKTVVMLGRQMIERLEHVHDCGVLYRDIKPHNFVMGRGEKGCGRVHLVDFGLCKRYRDEKTGTHCKMRHSKGRGVTGTVRYSSINIHEGYDASRRDDLLALGYVFLHLLRGDLPWLGLKAKNKKAKHDLIRKKKVETSDEELCAGWPQEFVQYFKHCKSLDFYDRPDYVTLRGLLDSALVRSGQFNDGQYDWTSMECQTRSHGERSDSKDSKETVAETLDTGRKRKHGK